MTCIYCMILLTSLAIVTASINLYAVMMGALFLSFFMMQVGAPAGERGGGCHHGWRVPSAGEGCPRLVGADRGLRFVLLATQRGVAWAVGFWRGRPAPLATAHPPPHCPLSPAPRPLPQYPHLPRMTCPTPPLRPHPSPSPPAPPPPPPAQYLYLPAATVLKRWAGDTASAVFVHVDESLQGMDVIRAFGAVDYFIQARRAGGAGLGVLLGGV